MTDACPCCTGSHYLSDNPEFGPCWCVTPEALTKVEGERDDLLEQEANAIRILDGIIAAVPGLLTAFEDYLVNSLGLPANPVTLEDQHLAELADTIDRLQLSKTDRESMETGGNRWSRAARYAVNLNDALGWWLVTYQKNAPPEKVKEAKQLFEFIQGEKL